MALENLNVRGVIVGIKKDEILIRLYINHSGLKVQAPVVALNVNAILYSDKYHVKSLHE